MEHTAAHPTARTYYTVYGALLVLLLVTVGIAEIHLGIFNFIAAALIASIKAALIILFFMHVRYSKPLIWIVACAGFFWLLILFGLTLADYFTRGQTPYSEQQAIERMR